ncbi:MAG: chromosome segregation protein SMC, partial [Acidobacteria bacterium]|nr:chromosome segregation protein SMC [Acidobacteriota bacterium]
ERTQRGYAIDHELRENGQHIASIALEISRAQERRRHNEERCQQLVVRAANSENELQQVAYKLAGLQTELDANRQVLHSAAQDLAAAHREEARAREEAASTAADLTQLESQQEQSRTGIMQLVAVSADLRNQLTQAEERRAVVDRDRGRVENELASACSEQEVFGGQRGQLVLEFESVSQKLAGVSEAIAALRQALECKRTDERESKRRLDGLRAEYATGSGRKNSLQAIIAEHGYSTESVRRLFQSGGMQGGLAPAGVLADFVEVESHYEGMVEDFLRDELNYVVVKSWDAADEGLRLLRSDVDGRATFLVHPNDAQAKFSFTVEERAQPVTPSQGIVPLRKCLRVLDGFGKSLEVIMPKLRDGYIVPDSSLGRELALRNPDAFFLSAQSGECFHNVTVTGGKQRAEGPLSLKRELRDLVHLVSELERALCLEDQRVVMLGKEISEFATRLEGLEEERRNVERQAMTSGHMLEQLDSEMTRLAERKRITEQELCRLNMDGAEQQNSIASIQDQLARLELRRAELEGQITTGQAALVSLRARRDSSTHNASQHMARVATLEERHRAAAQVLSRIESLVRDVSERAESLRLQHESSLQEKQERELENRQLSELLIALAAQRNATEAREGLLQSESEQVRTRLVEIEESVRLARQTLDQARDRRGELSANAAKLQADAHYMAETCRNELGIERHELMSDKSLVIVNRDQLIEQDTHYREMRTRLEAMGPVNMMALEEYKETAERHAFLETQRKDLLDSIENTVATIKEIDSVSRQKFEEAFHRINANFQHTFQKLFGGGQAFMRLTDEENSADSGIDVVASPPGKKLQNVLLLSGGEKALTALSLLVGIFQYQPSPFCILDEVDAPLDEANVGRFTELVKEMSVQTQFVLITHSKKTMSVAPVMYGITMQEPGVSKLVSVRLGASA